MIGVIGNTRTSFDIDIGVGDIIIPKPIKMSGYNAVLARNTEKAPKSIGPYSQTVAFSHYNHLSAQLPIDPRSGKLVAGGVKEQAGQCLKNIKAIIESIDHVMDDVVKVNIFLN